MMDDYETVVNAHPIRKGELKIVKKFHKKLPALIELCFLVDCTFSVVEKILGNNVVINNRICSYLKNNLRIIFLYTFYKDALLECYELC